MGLSNDKDKINPQGQDSRWDYRTFDILVVKRCDHARRVQSASRTNVAVLHRLALSMMATKRFKRFTLCWGFHKGFAVGFNIEKYMVIIELGIFWVAVEF